MSPLGEESVTHRHASAMAKAERGHMVVPRLVLLLLCLLTSFAFPADFASSASSLAEVYGYVWHDVNEDGLRDADEPGLGSVLIILATHAGAILRYTRTNGAGEYRFSGLAADGYLVSESDPEGFGSTTPNLVAVTVTDGAIARQDFGDTRLLPGCWHMVDGHIWHDADADGLEDEGEEPLQGIPARVLDLDGRTVAITASNQYGSYTVRGLAPDRYYVIVDAPYDLSFSRVPLYWGVDLRGCWPATIYLGLQRRLEATWSGDGLRDVVSRSDVREAADCLTCVAATTGQDLYAASSLSDEGNSSIAGTVSTLQTSTTGYHIVRRGASGVKITLVDAAGLVVGEQLTDSNGRYRFEGLIWQAYYLTQSPIEGYEPVLSRYWGAAITDECEVIIDLENRPTPGALVHQLHLPCIVMGH